MEKKNYVKPSCKVRVIYGDGIMQTLLVESGEDKTKVDTGGSTQQATGGERHRSKENFDFGDESEAGYNIWED